MSHSQSRRSKKRTENQFEIDSGVEAFVVAVRQHASSVQAEARSTTHFILRISDDFAFIRLRDLSHPFLFLKQLSGDPPVQFGTKGFRRDIVDDRNPARHYTAFVFVGYWLPMILGYLVLIAWEVLGYLRYGFVWSSNDVRCGIIGLRHGRTVRKSGTKILADLIEQDLTEKKREVR